MKYPSSLKADHIPGWEEQLERTLGFAMDQCTEFGVAIDGGSYVGTWSERMAHRFDHVYAFEPLESSRMLAEENLGSMRARVVLSSKALSDSIGEVRLKGRGADILRPDPSGVPYHTTTIDSLELTHVGLIKLDIEGGEEAAIRGAMTTIQRDHPVMIIETNGQKERIDTMMNELGYRIALDPYPLKSGKTTPDTVYVHD